MSYNIYAAYNFGYDFSSGISYVGKNGLIPEIVPDEIFVFTTFLPLKSMTIILFSQGMSSNIDLNLMCLDQNNEIIAGTESHEMAGPSVKSTYTFDTPLPENTVVKFRVLSASFPGYYLFDVCNLVMNTN